MDKAHKAAAYVGRFAPSPSGPLHFGSIVTALASFLEARSRGGRWLVRIDDLDPPREKPGASQAILATLAGLGLHWDGPVVFQSTRNAAYETALAALARGGLTFPCGCTRSDIAGGRYQGRCRSGIAAGRVPRTLRLRVEDVEIGFKDRLQGWQAQRPARQVGDFVLRRRGGYYAYHLAAVVDDAASGVTDVVRGMDLLASTPRQIYLQQRLGLTSPSYAHIPLVLDESGAKLSKRTDADPVDRQAASQVLVMALRFLRQDIDAHLGAATPAEILQRAVSVWDLARIGRDRRPRGELPPARD